jgi:tetratricopeptide (TPR) repeat protein
MSAMKAILNIRNLILGVLASLVFGVAAIAPAPVLADNHYIKPGKSLSGNYLAGRHAQARRDLSAAADFLGAALKQSPDVPNLLRRTFILMAAEGRINEAAILARRLIEAKAKAPVADLTLALVDINKGHFAAAEARLKGMPADGLSGFVSPVLRAWSLIGMKKNRQALKLLATTAPKTTDDKKPENKEKNKDKATQVLHALHAALMNELLGRNAEAEKLYLSVNDNPDNRSLRVVQLLGALYERTGRPEKAQALYDGYLKARPGSQFLDEALKRLKSGKRGSLKTYSVRDGAAEVLFGIAGSLRQRNLQETAMVLGRLALYLKPHFPAMQILLGDTMENANRLEPALSIYSSIERKSSFSWPARLRVASVLNRLERTEDAVTHLNRMAGDRKTDPAPLISLGDILRGHERFEEAAKAYDKALARIKNPEPRHWTLFYARGIAFERSKQWPRAEADFLSALKFKPEQPYVLNYLGYSWIDKGLYLERAQGMIAKAAELRPNDGYIVDSLGWVHYRLGRYDDAARELERAVELRPEDPIINDHLGDAYWRVGRKREAAFQWNRSLTLNPEKDLISVINRKLKIGLGDDNETAKKPGDDG